MLPRILVVDDEPNMRRTLAIVLGDGGAREVTTAASAEEALRLLDERDARRPFDLLLADLSLPGASGLELLRRARARDAELQLVMMTAFSTVQSAVEAMKLGAHEYLIKPFADDELLRAVDGALARARLGRRARRLAAGAPELGGMVGRSAAMREVFRVVERAAESDATVLVTGESGTGKELVARAIHALSRRREKPFVAVNCGALTETLLETELFGHERGAFTGAVKTRVGRLEQAHGGTIFLDEVADMSPALQTKLLRALEQREFQRVGGVETLRVDLRVVAATHVDLARAIADGKFREDLYYRLHVVALALPPLRARMDDLPLLVDAFLDEKCAEAGVPPKRVAPEAMALLAAHPFPGNVRELENLIERAVVLCDGEVIRREDFPVERLSLPRPRLEAFLGDSLKDGWVALQSAVKDLERQLLQRAVAAYGDRPNEEIARLLGTSRRILELRLAEFGIEKKTGGKV